MMDKNERRYLDYYVAHINYSPDSRLRLGTIIQCNKGDSFGIIYAYLYYRGRKSRIFYFKKKKNVSFDKHLAVSFLLISSTYDKPESYEVIEVTPLEKYGIYDFGEQKNHNEKKRSDGIYHYDEEWDVMCEGKPYIELSDCSIHAYYPLIDKKEQTIIYHDYSVYSRGKRTNDILSCFIGMYDLKQYSTEPTFEFVSSKFEEIKLYIENFKLSRNLHFFVAGQSGEFVNYPGRDDSFFITKYRRTSTKDSYLKQLVELYERTDYYNCNGRNDDDYDIIDKEETHLLRNEVKQKYDKNAHYMFLINEFITSIKQQREQYLLFADDIQNLIEVDDYPLFDKKYDKNAYWELILNYNNQKQ